jgi:hypothetical protein
MNIPVSVTIPDLWGGVAFSKPEWGVINYLVGPNGTGKTRFAAKLKEQLSQSGLQPRYLSAERLAGLERHNVMGQNSAFSLGFNVANYAQYKNYGAAQGLSSDAFVILKEKINVRIRIEAFLSSIFGRRIRFAEEGGYLRPKMQRILGGVEYSMKEDECNGIKELITLLAFLYDDEFNALVIDEPELHLHPQFQTFLLAEIRRLSGDPRVAAHKKVFFLITHSPYLLDFRVPDDLRHCVIFHRDSAPTCVGALGEQDEHYLKRLLPRLNTHHKQFFFANRPIFVEGYTDQQLFSLIQESRFKLLGATGACFIDVNGKDEQDFFFRLCRNLQIDAQFISDLDVLTRGSFRNSISADPRCKQFAADHGIGTDLMDGIRELNSRVDALVRAIEASTAQGLVSIKSAVHSSSETEAKRYRVLIAVIHFRQLLVETLPEKGGEIDYISAKAGRLADAARQAGVFLLPKGALENHMPSFKDSVFQVPDRAKTTTFEKERDFILSSADQAAIEARYGSLIPILDQASGSSTVNLRKHLSYTIGEFIGKVQRGFERGEVDSCDALKQHSSVEWKVFERILEVLSFVRSGGGFQCRMKLKVLVDPCESEFTFDDSTLHSKFTLPE